MSSGLSLYDVCLDAATSNVAISDGTNQLTVNADGSLNVVTSSVPKLSSIQTSVESVTTTAAEVTATPLTGRCGVVIQNTGNQPVYLGEDNTVTASTGICIPGKSSLQYDFGESVDMFLIAASGTQDVRILEVA